LFYKKENRVPLIFRNFLLPTLFFSKYNKALVQLFFVSFNFICRFKPFPKVKLIVQD